MSSIKLHELCTKKCKKGKCTVCSKCNRQFLQAAQKTKTKYKTQQQKSFIKAQDRIEVFQYYCSNCDNDFTTQSSMDRHICKPLEGDALNFSIGVTSTHLLNGGIVITSVDTVEGSGNTPTFSIDDLLPLQPVSIASEEVFEPKWAIRPGHGKMYGKKYILVYKDYLKELFELGERDPSKKMSAARMLESIQRDPVYTLRLDHPSESEIRSFVSSLLQSLKRKRNKEENPEASGSNSRVRLNITAEEFEFMHKIAQESPQLKPAIFYDQFIEKYPATALTVGQVKTKFSAVKSSNKR